jgi:hypothetical protein
MLEAIAPRNGIAGNSDLALHGKALRSFSKANS